MASGQDFQDFHSYDPLVDTIVDSELADVLKELATIDLRDICDMQIDPVPPAPVVKKQVFNAVCSQPAAAVLGHVSSVVSGVFSNQTSAGLTSGQLGSVSGGLSSGTPGLSGTAAVNTGGVGISAAAQSTLVTAGNCYNSGASVVSRAPALTSVTSGPGAHGGGGVVAATSSVMGGPGGPGTPGGAGAVASVTTSAGNSTQTSITKL